MIFTILDALFILLAGINIKNYSKQKEILRYQRQMMQEAPSITFATIPKEPTWGKVYPRSENCQLAKLNFEPVN